MYEEIIARDDLYISSETDPGAPAYPTYFQDYEYLGYDMFYIRYKVIDWYSEDDEGNAPVYYDAQHVIVKKADTLWGFQIVAMPLNFGTFAAPIQADWAMPKGFVY